MLVGRDAEMRLLDDLLEGARTGRSGVLALVGEVGIGKSALLDHAIAAAEGVHVLRARGVESEARIPFASLFELLRPALGYLDAVPPPQRAALESALALRPAQAGERFAVGAATLALLAAFADEQPVLVAVDDAHWLDGSTADALLFAMRRLVADPIAVVLTVRSDAPSLLDGSDVPVHHLHGLDPGSTRQLLGTAVSEEHAERLHRGTGGNPLALLELVGEEWAPPGTPVPVGDRLAAVYLARCQALAASSQDILLLASVSETGELSLLARAAASLGLAMDGLSAAEAVGLVTIEADRARFCHPLARSAVYGGAPADRRRAMHQALADALPDAEADRRAWHLALAAIGPDDAASVSLEQAARRARARSAYDVAGHAYDRAASLASDGRRRATLLLAGADAAWCAGLPGFASGLLGRARPSASPDDAIAIEQLRGHIAGRCGSSRDSYAILQRAALDAACTDPDRAVVMLANAVNAAFYAGDAALMRDGGDRIAGLRPTEPTARFLADIARGMALIFGGDGDRGIALVRRAVDTIERSDDLPADPRLATWAAMGPLWLREATRGQALLQRAFEVARTQSAIGELPFLLTHVAIDRASSDRWAEAAGAFHEAIGFARETGQRTDLAFALAQLGLLEARQGREDSCRGHIEEARAIAAETGAGVVEIWCLRALGELDLGQGRTGAALVHFEAQATELADRHIGDADLSPGPELVELALRSGDTVGAAARLDAFAAAAARKGQPWSLARAARCRALVAPDVELDRQFAEALAWHARTPDGFETARTRLAYGARLRRARQRVRAREQLRAALDAFDRLGAQPWSDIAQSELAATGATARRRDPSTQRQLTPQELQIVMLLVGGKTTREAAAALFLSPKTIEYHLRNVYRKLGVSSRDALAAAMTSEEQHAASPSAGT